MGKVLVIAEKPSMAGYIATVLGCEARREGYLEGGEYIISWSLGHLVGLAEPEEYDGKYAKWSYDTLPIIPEEFKLRISKPTYRQYRVLERLMNSAWIDRLICATDAGREGELIFRYIYWKSRCKKPFERLWLASTTEKDIKDAFSKLKDGKCYDSLYQSALARACSDWLIGINLTRALSLAYNGTCTIGRVQTPTLDIIVARELEILRFKPKDYYKICGIFRNRECAFAAEYWEDEERDGIPAGAIRNKKTAGRILDVILNGPRDTWKVVSAEKEEKSESPPLLYNLAELQRDANKSYGLTAAETLKIAQVLYEDKKAITYPRTDSQYIPESMQDEAVKIIRVLSRLNSYSQYLPKDTSEAAISKRVVNDGKVTDHYAIIPTASIPVSLSENEHRLYDLVVRRFIALFLPENRYIHMTVEIKNEGVNGKFVASWNKSIEPGWKALYKNGGINDIIPDLKINQYLDLISTKCEEHRTRPPARYTDGTLIPAMEGAGRLINDETLRETLKGKGLGTSATRAGIIEKLIKTGYIRRSGKLLVPEDKGMNLIKSLEEDGFSVLKSPELTGEWESKLDLISRGELEFGVFMEEIKSLTADMVERASSIACKRGDLA